MTTLHTVAATGALKLSWLLLVFPLVGAVVLLTGGRRTDRWGHLLGVAMPVAAFVYGVIAFFSLLGDSQRSQDVHVYSWIPVAGFQVNFNLLVDQLSQFLAGKSASWSTRTTKIIRPSVDDWEEQVGPSGDATAAVRWRIRLQPEGANSGEEPDAA